MLSPRAACPLQPGGVPEPLGGAGGSASPPGGAPARSGLWKAPLTPARQAHAVQSAGTGSLFSSAPGDRGPDHTLSLICLLQGPYSAQQRPLWLWLMSCRSSNQASHRTRHLLRSPWAPGPLTPAAAGTFMSTSMGPVPRQALSWIISFNPNPTGRCGGNCHFTLGTPGDLPDSPAPSILLSLALP